MKTPLPSEQDLAGGSQTLPSRLYLPKLESPPATILDHLIEHFARVQPCVWRSRVSRGLVTLSDGTTVREDSRYRHGITVFYRKEVPSEPAPLEEAVILYRDEEILVADKPHGMVVTPSGQHLDRSLLVRLQKSTGVPTLAPMHRLDCDTAGILLFAFKPDARDRYHRLFVEGLVEREYLAVAKIRDTPSQKTWRVENRLESGDPWYRQRIVDGPVNAITEIELLDMRKDVGLFRLFPKSGRKHQLRVHMASMGLPIVGDPFYPKIREKQNDEPPLQLLARRLVFVDPLSGARRSFASDRQLVSFQFSPEV